VPHRQTAAGRRLRVAGLAAAEQPALSEDLGAARAVDRAVDSAAAEQGRVGGVDDRVDVLLGDVAADRFDHGKLTNVVQLR